jgi:pentose-5-phosphate-3-epimerase
MTVDPGKQGSPFLSLNLEKIAILRDEHFSEEILVDGGIDNLTFKQVIKQKYLPDILCVGSYLTKAKNPFKNFQLLKAMSDAL